MFVGRRQIRQITTLIDVADSIDQSVHSLCLRPRS
jgi:hypothetical protein